MDCIMGLRSLVVIASIAGARGLDLMNALLKSPLYKRVMVPWSRQMMIDTAAANGVPWASSVDWLRAQRPPLRSVARALQLEWSGSEVTATAAGFDEVHAIRELDQLAAAARALPPGAQYYGGLGGGGMARFVLPRLELKRCQGRTVLACHIRWAAHEAGAAADGWEAAREAAARALEELITSEALPQSVLPAPVS